MSKGTTRRPQFVSEEVMADNWDRAFSSPKDCCLNCAHHLTNPSDAPCCKCSHITFYDTNNWEPKTESVHVKFDRYESEVHFTRVDTSEEEES